MSSREKREIQGLRTLGLKGKRLDLGKSFTETTLENLKMSKKSHLVLRRGIFRRISIITCHHQISRG